MRRAGVRLPWLLPARSATEPGLVQLALRAFVGMHLRATAASRPLVAFNQPSKDTSALLSEPGSTLCVIVPRRTNAVRG